MQWVIIQNIDKRSSIYLYFRKSSIQKAEMDQGSAREIRETGQSGGKLEAYMLPLFSAQDTEKYLHMTNYIKINIYMLVINNRHNYLRHNSLLPNNHNPH